VAIIGLLPLNIALGLQYRDWYDHNLDTFAADIRAGVPADQLAADGPVVASAVPTMRASMTYLRQARVGVFSQLVEHQGVLAPGQEIDGFDAGAGGWAAAPSPETVAVMTRSAGRPTLRWVYDPSPAKPAVLRRSFPVPQDWRGQGAIAVTFVGEGRGRPIEVDIDAASTEGGIDRFATTFVDDQVGTRTLVLPWNAFLYFNPQGQMQWWVKPMPQQGIAAVAFSTAQPGAGSLLVERVALQPGHAEFGWPLHPAADRRSLPPWR
jgi:hypothetical protein